MNHFDWMAPFYDRLLGPPDIERWRRLLQLPSCGRVLDAGGGTGRVSSRLHSWSGNLVVSDLSHAMLKQAKNKDHLWPVRARTENLPFADRSFDRVLVVDALHHFQEPQQALQELRRVLKPGGCLVIEEPDIHRFAVKGVALIEKWLLMRSHFYPADEIRDRLTSLGLSARIEADGGYFVWVIGEK